MHIRSLILATLAASALLIVPASALTLGEVYDQLGGTYCSGNTCTESETITTNVENPDIENPDTIVSTDVVVSPATSEGPGGETVTVGCLKVTMAGNPIPEDRLAFFCTGNNSLSPLRGGVAAVIRTDTSVIDGGFTDGGISIVDTCSTTTHTVSHSGHNPFKGYSIDSETSESPGAC